MRDNKGSAFGAGGIIGALGGLIGLGGADFRLPLLIGLFQFAALEAVILTTCYAAGLRISEAVQLKTTDI
ncbi:sulfite exporter TauE/SafE family protein, partial [Rhizobium ruizarguesonis]